MFKVVVYSKNEGPYKEVIGTYPSQLEAHSALLNIFDRMDESMRSEFDLKLEPMEFNHE